MPNPVAVVASGQSRCGKRLDVNYPELVREAVVAALDDAGIGIDRIQAVVTGSMPAPMEGVNSPHLYWVDAMGAAGKPVIRVATCGSTGISIAHAAFYHVASGLFDLVLAVGAQKMYEGEPQGTMATVADPFFRSQNVAARRSGHHVGEHRRELLAVERQVRRPRLRSGYVQA